MVMKERTGDLERDEPRSQHEGVHQDGREAFLLPPMTIPAIAPVLSIEVPSQYS
jgi:hypothetical protein